jgi:cell division protein FtsB
MADLASSPTAPETAAEYEAALDQMLAEMRLLNEQMQKDRVDIDRLKAETHALKAESATLEAETRAILARLTPPA